ncbi:MAG: hypothetical protein HS104_35355 [Polyangiaceae bacterium]|nr:hypothetical protein [Polyangiaceae bacterium]
MGSTVSAGHFGHWYSQPQVPVRGLLSMSLYPDGHPVAQGPASVPPSSPPVPALPSLPPSVPP